MSKVEETPESIDLVNNNADPYSKEITKAEWEIINRRYVQMKDNRYFGLSWLSTNKQTDEIRKLNSDLSSEERFKKVKKYVNDNPDTTLTKAIKEAIPKLNNKR